MSTIDQPTIHLVALVGSLRAQSAQSSAAQSGSRAAFRERQHQKEVGIGNLPLYNQDFETTGLPAEVV